jgi:hypothetical protein
VPTVPTAGEPMAGPAKRDSTIVMLIPVAIASCPYRAAFSEMLANGQALTVGRRSLAVTHETLDQIKLAQHKLIAKS